MVIFPSTGDFAGRRGLLRGGTWQWLFFMAKFSLVIFLIYSHQLFPSAFASLSFLKIFFRADLTFFLTELQNRVLAGGGGILAAYLARKLAFSLPWMLQWLGIHSSPSSLFCRRIVDRDF
jgi:hypothetical protein